MLPWLQAWPIGADLVVAVDVLVYIGDLTPLFAAVARVLTPLPSAGLFAFTVQVHTGQGYALGADLRFAHCKNYLRDCARGTGLQAVTLDSCTTRRDAGLDVPGYVVVLTRAGANP